MSAYCAHCDVKLEAILSKLELLDTIEKSVKSLHETLAIMGSRILSLESAQATINREINDVQDSLSFTQDQLTKSIASIQSLKDQTNLKLAELTRKNDELDGKIKELKSKNLYLGAYSRRDADATEIFELLGWKILHASWKFIKSPWFLNVCTRLLQSIVIQLYMA